MRAGKQPIDRSFIRGACAPDEPVLARIEAFDVEFLPRLDSIHTPELRRQNDLSLRRHYCFHKGKITSYLVHRKEEVGWGASPIKGSGKDPGQNVTLFLIFGAGIRSTVRATVTFFAARAERPSTWTLLWRATHNGRARRATGPVG